MQSLCKIISAEKFSEVSLNSIPNGSYSAVWGGYEIKANIRGITYRFRTDVGIKTPRAECTLTVLDGDISVTIP